MCAVAMTVARVATGAFLGALGWVGLAASFPLLPPVLRFSIPFIVLTFGSGAIIAVPLTRDLDALTRSIVALAIGTGAAPVLIDVLGRVGAAPAYPYVATALAGSALATWNAGGGKSRPPSPTDVGACALLVTVALATGAVAFAHRLVMNPSEVVVYGSYDSVDLTYYASITAEASHTVPPTAAYYSGHGLNYAYFPQLILATVRRVADVPVLRMYFGYAWPGWLSIAAAMMYVLVRTLARARVSLVAVLLLLVAGDFSYLAAWWLRQVPDQWDFLLWPTNFLSPTMEVLHFNSWTPSLPVFFAALYGVVRGFQTSRRTWFIVSGLCIAVLFQFKPFAFVVLAAALGCATAFSGRDWPARRRFALTLGVAVTGALPFIYRSLALYADRRSQLELQFFQLPERMLIKLGLLDAFTGAMERAVPLAALRRPAMLVAATALFFAVGFGVRWLGVPAVGRALQGRTKDDTPSWRFLAWIVVCGVGIPFVLVTNPYNDTLQFYQTGLYVMWIFAAGALVGRARGPWAATAATLLAIAVSLPSSLHYLTLKWSDNARPPVAALNSSELTIAEYLRRLPPEQTVILHDRPFDPSLLNVVSERRVVLGWARYAVGSDDRRLDVDRFFRSAAVDPGAALEVLRRYKVTHVVDHVGRDQIHPRVLAQLRPVLTFSDVVLYAVPAVYNDSAP